MATSKKLILFLVLCAVVIGGSLVAKFSSSPFALCKVMDKPELEAAIARGFNVNVSCCVEHMFGECMRPKPNSTPLVYAVEVGNTEAVQLLLDHGADPNKASDMGDAFTVASRQGRLDMIDALQKHGATGHSQIDALPTAAHAGQVEIAMDVLAQVSAGERPEACRVLFCALTSELVQRGSPLLARQRELFLRAVQSCADPNVVCKPWHLLSHIARDDENAPLVKALIEKGANLDAKEDNGKTVRQFLKSFNDYQSRPRIKALLEGA